MNAAVPTSRPTTCWVRRYKQRFLMLWKTPLQIQQIKLNVRTAKATMFLGILASHSTRTTKRFRFGEVEIAANSFEPRNWFNHCKPISPRPNDSRRQHKLQLRRDNEKAYEQRVQLDANFRRAPQGKHIRRQTERAKIHGLRFSSRGCRKFSYEKRF